MSAGQLVRTFRCAAEFVIHPRQAADEVALDPQSLWAGVWLATGYFGAYALTVVIYHLLGHQPMAKPSRPIPLDRWYLVETFTTLPVGMASCLAYAGVAS